MPMTPAGAVVLAKPSTAKTPARRFTDKPDLDPSAVWSLPKDHAALKESRTLFPSTVVTVDESFEDRLLISGKNNRKLGDRIAKGKFKGYALYCLSLEERATCPKDCAALGYCYGNGMRMARRHRIEDLEFFFTVLEDEIREILAVEDGLMVRLHVLGDFPSVDYVQYWCGLLDRHPNLAVFGYTHRKPKARGGDDIGDEIEASKTWLPDRFRIRWSSDKLGPDRSIIINEIPDGPRFKGALVCPAQTDATACCASCGLCWELAASRETIAFIKHGKKSLDVLAASEAEAHETVSDSRKVSSVTMPSGVKPAIINTFPPEIRIVKPQSLLIEPKYQRDLSGKSVQLIRKIVAGFDWTKFKPPVCAETKDGLFVIDGQHTAIAAATHPDIAEIPVMVVAASYLEKRAAAFVSHNRDRLVMTPAQIFYGDLAAGDKNAKLVMECVVKAGALVPRLPVAKGYWKPGQIAAIGAVREVVNGPGASTLERMLKIAVEAKLAPISASILRALRTLLTEDAYRAARMKPDSAIAAAIVSMPDLEVDSMLEAAQNGVSRFRACADLIFGALK